MGFAVVNNAFFRILGKTGIKPCCLPRVAGQVLPLLPALGVGVVIPHLPCLLAAAAPVAFAKLTAPSRQYSWRELLALSSLIAPLALLPNFKGDHCAKPVHPPHQTHHSRSVADPICGLPAVDEPILRGDELKRWLNALHTATTTNK